jgi:hypothetical protein
MVRSVLTQCHLTELLIFVLSFFFSHVDILYHLSTDLIYYKILLVGVYEFFISLSFFSKINIKMTVKTNWCRRCLRLFASSTIYCFTIVYKTCITICLFKRKKNQKSCFRSSYTLSWDRVFICFLSMFRSAFPVPFAHP